MENAYVPNTQLTSPAARILSRDELNTITELFVLNPAYLGFLRGTSKHLADRKPMFLTLLLVIFAVMIVGISLFSGSAAATAVTGLIFLALIAWSLVNNNRLSRLEQQGQLLQAQITNVYVRQRAGWANILYGILNVVLIIMEFVDMFSSNSNSSYRRGYNSTLGYDPGDFYEVNIDFSAATPGGGQLTGKAKQNRPDLRNGTVPTAGNSAVILYVDDSQYKLL